MTMQKLLTIIVPSYNMEHYLNRCVSSLLSLASDELIKTEVPSDLAKQTESKKQ